MSDTDHSIELVRYLLSNADRDFVDGTEYDDYEEALADAEASDEAVAIEARTYRCNTPEEVVWTPDAYPNWPPDEDGSPEGQAE